MFTTPNFPRTLSLTSGHARRENQDRIIDTVIGVDKGTFSPHPLQPVLCIPLPI
jgi:hypothetical protein